VKVLLTNIAIQSISIRSKKMSGIYFTVYNRDFNNMKIGDMVKITREFEISYCTLNKMYLNKKNTESFFAEIIQIKRNDMLKVSVSNHCTRSSSLNESPLKLNETLIINKNMIKEHKKNIYEKALNEPEKFISDIMFITNLLQTLPNDIKYELSKLSLHEQVKFVNHTFLMKK